MKPDDVPFAFNGGFYLGEKSFAAGKKLFDFLRIHTNRITNILTQSATCFPESVAFS